MFHSVFLSIGEPIETRAGWRLSRLAAGGFGVAAEGLLRGTESRHLDLLLLSSFAITSNEIRLLTRFV